MFGGLFAKPSVIDNEKLVSEKKRTIVQLRKKERKERKREEKREQKVKEETGEESDLEAEIEHAEEEDASAEKDNGDVRMDVDEQDEEDPDLEDKYMQKLLQDDDDDDTEEQESDEEEAEKEQKEEAAGEEGSPTEGEASEKPASAAKVLDLKEKEFEKAERTIFIGNVPSVIMSSKRDTKDFKQFINKFLETPENTSSIESIRFRSIHSTSNAPRKVAFIAKDVDLENVMNSYVVFKKKDDSLKALKLNGVLYKDHHLRVDHLTHPTKKDNKLSVFVGNLDFQEKEEALWKYFNDKLIAKEDKKDTTNVIDNVRIVRDPKTSFGKGFAIVQFSDTNYVTKALLLDGKKMGKRSLRITRCKKPMRNNEKMRSKFSKLNDQQKTVVGRAKQLGKIDRRTLGQVVIEGDRATKGQTVGGIGKKRHGGRKEKRAKKARITKRSSAFKEKSAE
ncbi:hypothetical protein PMKS-001167 [Pichia membranifaciens]|uniref:Nucleolar protein 12 n=1 Tax=Pichia membranifaciens TaxID=4926 RepID=A0A1Q2YDT2_9ASCO|nr:hypothetical protein PMKS-001167 [Pichia membranifaciens]